MGLASMTGCRQTSAPERTPVASAIPAEVNGESVRAQPPILLAEYLPDRAGTFVAGPRLLESGFVRRNYTRGATTVGVTIADAGQATVPYDDWLNMSAGYVQAALDVPAAEAAGFYTCTGPRDAGQCDLHIHCRAGYHLEILGGGASRADLDEVVRSLGIRALLARGARS
jgi:hypothetical protein